MTERDPDRLFLKTTTGDVQAWAPEGEIAVSVAFQTHEGAAHASYGHYMTVADARSLAAALLAAADHVDGLGVQ